MKKSTPGGMVVGCATLAYPFGLKEGARVAALFYCRGEAETPRDRDRTGVCSVLRKKETFKGKLKKISHFLI